MKDEESIPEFQLQLISTERPKAIRAVDSNSVSKLIVIRGIVISITKPQIKATKLVLRCSNCNEPYEVKLGRGLKGGYTPRSCPRATVEKCPLDPFVPSMSECKFINIQKMRIQENPEEIPSGETPRSYLVSCDRELVDKVYAGCRVTVVGVLSIIGGPNMKTASKTNDAIKETSYIHALGLQIGRASCRERVSSPV